MKYLKNEPFFIRVFNMFFLVIFTFLITNSANLKIVSAEELIQRPITLPEVNFFYSVTCPFCNEQKKFHENLMVKYPNLVINQYDVAKRESAPILRKLAKENGAEAYLGMVPLTFIGDSFIAGFGGADTTGLEIEKAIIIGAPGLLDFSESCEDGDDELCLLKDDPLFNADGNISNTDGASYTVLNQTSSLSRWGIDAQKLPLPILSIVLGALDGFNVCSLGALMLILSLVIGFKSRKKIMLFGGLFILITGITYTLLVFIWSSVFSLIAPFLPYFEIVIATFGLIGAFIFFKQYLRFRKYGPQCEISNSKFINNAVRRLQETFKSDRSKIASILAVIAFSFVVTVIEFPCSAVIPVAFAAILADAGVAILGQLLYIGIFMLFYLLDEIIIFVIAVYTLKLWTGGPKMTLKLTLAQALFFLAIAVFYFGKLFKLF